MTSAAHRDLQVEPTDDDFRRRLDFALAAGKMGEWQWLIPEQRVIWSPAMEELHGIPKGSFRGTLEAHQEDIHPDDKARVSSALQRLLVEHGEHDLTYRIVRPDGAERWIQASAQLAFDKQGNPVGLAGVCRDVTVEKEAEQNRERLLAAEALSREAERGQRRLRAILESIADPFSVFDEELRVTFMNEAALQLGGFERSQVLGKRLWDVAPESKDTAFSAAYRRVLEEKVPTVVEDYFAPWDRWFEARIFPVERGISVYTREITDRKKAEALRERLGRYAALRADVSGALAQRKEPRSMLQGCCEAFVEHLGVAFARIWTLDEASATLLLQASAGLYTHIDGGHRAVPVGKFKIGRIAEERQPHLSNDVLSDPLVGDPAWAKREGMVSFAGYPLLVDGRLMGVLAMFGRSALADDTIAALAGVSDTVAQGIARRLAEQELALRVEELARSNAELEQFAYVASHDLQEPLRVVASYNQLIARRYAGKLDQDADEFIAFTVDGVKRMQGLINDLLTYSRIGRRGKDFADVDLNRVLDLAQQNVNQAILERNAVVDHDPLPTVFGDESQLVQLFQNLLSNAIKFCADSPPRISITAIREPTVWTISVKDNGIGIDREYFDRIFVIFQRLHPREKYPGTGIGLAVCKKIVERHGGRIWAESQPGNGSTIVFSIPLENRSRTTNHEQ